MIFVKHTGGGSITFAAGGEMVRLWEGDSEWVPDELYESYKHKLEPIEAFRESVVVTGQLQAGDAVLPKWKLRLTPQEYLDRYGDDAKNSELAKRIIEE